MILIISNRDLIRLFLYVVLSKILIITIASNMEEGKKGHSN